MDVAERIRQWVQGWDPRRRSEDFRRSLRNALLNSGEGLLAPLLWLASTPFFVRLLGYNQFGIWMLVSGFVGVGGVFSFGLTEATIKYVSKYRALGDRAGVQRIVRATLLCYAVVGVVAALLAYGLSPWVGRWVFRAFDLDDAGWRLGVTALRIGGLGILLRFLDNVFQSVLQGYERHDLNSAVGMVVQVVTVSLNLVLAFMGMGLVPLLWTTLAVLLVGVVVKAGLIRRHLIPGAAFVPAIDLDTFRELRSFGFYSWLQSALGVINANLDRFLISGYLSPAAVTYYTVCFQLTTQVHFLLTRAASFLFPFSSSMFEQGDHARLRQVYHTASFTIVVLATSMIVPIYLLGDSILTVWMGAEFAEKATLILRIFCFRIALVPLGIVNYNYLLGSGLVRFQALIVSMTAPATIAGMFLLIPEHGGVGAAVAQLFSLPFMLFSRFFIEKKLFHEIDPLGNLSYLAPALVPFGLATLVIVELPFRVLSVVPLVFLLGVLAVLCGGGAYALGRLLQRVRWMPA